MAKKIDKNFVKRPNGHAPDRAANGSTRLQSLRQIAQKLARIASESEEAITEIYFFPDKKEIRLVELDPTTIPSGERVSPFYHPPDPRAGIPFSACIALILPEEKDRLPLPEDWGGWADAVLLYRKKDLAA